MRAVCSAVAGLLAIALASASNDVSACGEVVFHSGSKRYQEVAAAEKALDEGRFREALGTILPNFPGIRSTTAGQKPVATRALRVFALTLVRLDGSLPAFMVEPRFDELVPNEPSPESPPAWTRTANLEWALETLREIDRARPNDPAAQADVGEALARFPDRQMEALTILDRLAQRDLMGSPHAYAALARLRADRGDAAGAESAQERCVEMARSPSLCREAPAAKSIAKPIAKTAKR